MSYTGPLRVATDRYRTPLMPRTAADRDLQQEIVYRSEVALRVCAWPPTGEAIEASGASAGGRERSRLTRGSRAHASSQLSTAFAPSRWSVAGGLPFLHGRFVRAEVVREHLLADVDGFSNVSHVLRGKVRLFKACRIEFSHGRRIDRADRVQTRRGAVDRLESVTSGFARGVAINHFRGAVEIG